MPGNAFAAYHPRHAEVIAGEYLRAVRIADDATADTHLYGITQPA